MNDNSRIDWKLLFERGFFRFVLIFVFFLIIGSVAFVVQAVQQNNTPSQIVQEQNDVGKGQPKPLPDFIVDELPNNELEMLKP